ncbi:hypothetical protein ACHMW6_25715 [Pseudoduganella sp. UC29_106]|uniref:hypothetical protein n=1 Tax=Pseudoduganella sp. UC29_106 TaxID=3374553 RepID=UPI0037570500
MRFPSSAGCTVAIGNAFRSFLRRIYNWCRKPHWLLFEMADSRLIFAEKTFSIRHPIDLVARIDRAYGDGNALALVELKTRRVNQIFESDVIELSAQRVAIQFGTQFRVRQQGYILLQNLVTRRTIAHKV